MCGILGQVNRNHEIERNNFKVMLDTLEKRGPDAQGIYYRNNVILGHRRLKIIDLSDTSNQPMVSKNQEFVIVFNGEIYNYQEIKNNLIKRGHIFTTNSDTEVLLNCYIEYGEKVTELIDGMFAFAIYDLKQNSIFCARDIYGEKPFLYYFDNYNFIFGSELKAIIKHESIKNILLIDHLSLLKFLYYGYIPSPHTIYDKIKKLEAGTSFVFDIRNWMLKDKRKFFYFEDKYNENIYNSEKDILFESERLLKQSVRRRLVSDVPIGIFLSGGIDSSLVLKYASEISNDIKAFSISYKDSPTIDESKYAMKIAEMAGVECELCYFENALVEKNFTEIINYLDEPMADHAIIPLYYLAKFSKNHIVVALTGDGGDELFGGYTKYRAQYLIEKFNFLSILAKYGHHFFKKNVLLNSLLYGFNKPFYARQFSFSSFKAEEIKNLMNKDFHLFADEDRIFEDAKSFYDSFLTNDFINKSLLLDCLIQLPDSYLVKADIATMANSLESRTPFLNKDLTRFVFSLSGKWKIRGNKGKYILKKIASQYYAKDLVYRKKLGFGVPMDKWIRDELNKVFENVLLNFSHNFFNKNYIENLFYEHLALKKNNAFQLYKIFIFNYFYEINFK